MKNKNLFITLLLIAVIAIGCVANKTAVSAAGTIPPDAMLYKGHYYYLYQDELSWEDAKKKCESLGGHLATITSEQEDSAIYDYIHKQGCDNAYFGLYRNDEYDTWKWVTYESVEYTNWNPGEPNNAGEEYCAGYYNDYYSDKWNDYNAANLHAYICEWDSSIQIDESLTVDTEAITVDENGNPSTNSIFVDTAGSGGFTVSTYTDWIQIGKTSGESNSFISFDASASFYVSCSANPDTYQRTGTITITHQNGSLSRDIQVTQDAKVIPSVLRLDVTEMSADRRGVISGNSQVTVSTDGTGNFQANCDVDWIKIGRYSWNSDSYGTFSDGTSLYIFVDKNELDSNRTGTVTFTHEDGSTKATLKVTQEMSKAELTVDNTELSANSDGSLIQNSVKVNTNDTGNFQVESNADWIKVAEYSWRTGSSSLSFSNSATFYVSVSKNTTGAARTGTITITHQDGKTKAVVTVNQAKMKGSLVLSSIEVTAKMDGTLSRKSINVNTKGTGGFDVNSDVDWIKIGKYEGEKVSSLTFDDSADFYLFVDKNEGEDSRTGTITITHKDGETKSKVNISQGNAELEVSPTEITANASGVLSNSSVKVNTNGTGGFDVKTDASWIHLGKSKDEKKTQLSFTDSNSFYISVEKGSTESSREGTITVTHSVTGKQTTITISQGALQPVLDVDYKEKSAKKDGTFYNNAVTVTTKDTGSYTVEVESSCSWLGVSSTSTTDFNMGLSKLNLEDDTKFYIVASENKGAERSAVIKITHSTGALTQEIKVTQTGTDDSEPIVIDRSRVEFDSGDAAFSSAIEVYADDDVTWTVSVPTETDWIKITEYSSSYTEKYQSLEGKGNKSFYIYVSQNAKLTDRGAYITISSPGMEENLEIYVAQFGREQNIGVLLEELDVTVTNSTFAKGKYSKIRISYPEGLYASDVKRITYLSNNTKVAKVSSKGTIAGIRTGKANIWVKVTLESGDYKKFKLRVTVGTKKVKITNMTQ